MRTISIHSALKKLCPQLKLACIEADVLVSQTPTALLFQINEKIRQISQSLPLASISQLPPIAASRRAYKACGKDPARYRASAEALLRRAVSGKGLYNINNVVDQLNLVSISTGFSIGGYDADKIKGDIVFGIGNAGEDYSGIGRGWLNIEGMPVFRDAEGAFGSPTSDSPRTEVNTLTINFLMAIIAFENDDSLNIAAQLGKQYLTDFCGSKTIKLSIIE